MQPKSEERQPSRKLEVGLRLRDSHLPATRRTLEVGMDGVFLDATPNLRCGQVVELSFDDAAGVPVCVDCVVEPYGWNKHHLRYCELHQDRRDRLERIVWPAWDGANLLDGLVLMAGRYGASSLSDWMRLTSLLTSIQPRMAHRRFAAA